MRSQKKNDKLEVSKLTIHIGFWMRLVSNSVSHAFAKKVEATGVTIAEWVILSEMYAGDDTTSPGSVADLTGLSKGAVSKLISRLLEKGLVTRKEAHNDRRYQDIKLTQAGLKLVPRLAKLADENDEEFFSVLSKSDRKVLTDTLKQLAVAHKLNKRPVE